MAMMRISVGNSKRRFIVTEEAQEACGYGNATSKLHTIKLCWSFPGLQELWAAVLEALGRVRYACWAVAYRVILHYGKFGPRRREDRCPNFWEEFDGNPKGGVPQLESSDFLTSTTFKFLFLITFLLLYFKSIKPLVRPYVGRAPVSLAP